MELAQEAGSAGCVFEAFWAWGGPWGRSADQGWSASVPLGVPWLLLVAMRARCLKIQRGSDSETFNAFRVKQRRQLWGLEHQKYQTWRISTVCGFGSPCDRCKAPMCCLWTDVLQNSGHGAKWPALPARQSSKWPRKSACLVVEDNAGDSMPHYDQASACCSPAGVPSS